MKTIKIKIEVVVPYHEDEAPKSPTQMKNIFKYHLRRVLLEDPYLPTTKKFDSDGYWDDDGTTSAIKVKIK